MALCLLPAYRFWTRSPCVAQAQRAAWAQRAGGPGIQEGPGRERKPRRTGEVGRRKALVAGPWPPALLPQPTIPGMGCRLHVSLCHPGQSSGYSGSPGVAITLPSPALTVRGMKRSREANAVPKEAQFLTSRAARTRHSLDRREGLESQDTEMLASAGCWPWHGPASPHPLPRGPPPSKLQLCFPPGCRGRPGGRSDPLSSPKVCGVRPWSHPSFTETS